MSLFKNLLYLLFVYVGQSVADYSRIFIRVFIIILQQNPTLYHIDLGVFVCLPSSMSLRVEISEISEKFIQKIH